MRAKLMARTKKRLPAEKKNPDAITLFLRPGEDRARAEAALHLRPTTQAGQTVRAYSKGKDGSGPDCDALLAELHAQVAAVNAGDLRRPEAMLISQAHALDAMFGHLARVAVAQEYLPQYEAHMRLALKAQAQCARSLEVLGNLKNPAPVAFVRQANIAHGPQQVNNGLRELPSRAQDKIQNQANELLGATDGERLDFGTSSAAGGADSTLEAVDALNRPEDAKR